MAIDTTDFINTHGRQPRGRGTWMFKLVRTFKGTALTTTVTVTDTYGNASFIARTKAAERRAQQVILLP